MIMDAKTKYWKEALQEAFADNPSMAFTFVKDISEESWTDLAASLAVSAENESMAFGYDKIPSPYLAEIAQLEKQRRMDEEAYRRDLSVMKSNYESIIARLRQRVAELEKIQDERR